MTPQQTPHQPQPAAQSLRRAAARAVAALPVALVVVGLPLISWPAAADVPEGWSDPKDVDTLAALLLLAGLPLLLFVLITVAVYVPAMVRGEKLTPGPAERESTWFGGPRRGTTELAAPDDGDSAAGGARGSW